MIGVGTSNGDGEEAIGGRGGTTGGGVPQVCHAVAHLPVPYLINYPISSSSSFSIEIEIGIGITTEYTAITMPCHL